MSVEDFKARITELAEIMDQFRLSEAELESDGQRIVFRRRPASPPVQMIAPAGVSTAIVEEPEPVEPEMPPVSSAPAGTPVSSPMTGIFYTAPSPNSAPFVKEGDTVAAGQVVGLIEAMKVFNEITASTSGRVLSIVVESGAVVQPGDPLLYIGQ